MDKKLEILEKLIDRALDQLYQEDSYLIKNGVHERSIVFRFAHYLQNLMDESNELKEFDLDLEYNKNGRFAKRIPARICGTFPDLIIHKRGTNNGNLLIVEFKTWWNPNTREDKKKLLQFVDSNGEYKYFGGKSIVFNQRRECVTIWTCMRSNHPDAP